jgi:hypothetical protein
MQSNFMSLPTQGSFLTMPPGISAHHIELESTMEILNETPVQTSGHDNKRTSQLSTTAFPAAISRSTLQDTVVNSSPTLSDSSAAWVVQAPGFKFPPFGSFAMKYNPFSQIRFDMTDQEITNWAENQKDDTMEAIRRYPSSELLSAVPGLKTAARAEKKVAFAILENSEIASSSGVSQVVSHGSTDMTRIFSDLHQSFGITTRDTNLGFISVSPICGFPTPSVSRWSSSFRSSPTSSNNTSQTSIALLQPLRQPFPPGNKPNFSSDRIGRLHLSIPSSGDRQSASSSCSSDESAHGHVGIRTVFRPSTMLLEKQGILPAREEDRSGTRYLGDKSSNSFRSQIRDLADHLNCSLWITGIPVSVTISEIFNFIRCGAVFALHLSSPNNGHLKIAAKLVFMTPDSAERFIEQAKSEVGCCFGGFRVFVGYNRDGYLRRAGTETRVLRIEGPRDTMNWGFWERYFQQACVFDMDRWRYLPCFNPNRMKMEFQFARVDGQAQTCRLKIMVDEELSDQVSVEYGPDPCDPSNPLELNLLRHR